MDYETRLILNPLLSPQSSIPNPQSSKLKIALISDIHGNLPAFRAVLERIDAEGVDAILCLGDIVGYGPMPSECVDLMMERNIPSVMGNHDACVVGRLEYSFFREPNRSLLRWTADKLRHDQREWLSKLPMTLDTPAASGGGQGVEHASNQGVEHASNQGVVQPSNQGVVRAIAAHATPINPEKWQWLDSAITCREVLARVDYDFVFVGHTHVPALIASELGVFGLERGYKFLINPGSVGQGRDHDRRASFGIIDFEAFTYQNIRIHYDNTMLLAAFEGLGYSSVDIRTLMSV